MQASSASFATVPLTATHVVRVRGSTALAAYATYKAALLLTNQSRWQPANGQATKFSLNIVNRATHTVEAIVDPVDSLLRGELVSFPVSHTAHPHRQLSVVLASIHLPTVGNFIMANHLQK